MPERHSAAGPLADYVIGMRVMTVEGYPGTIDDIHEGPADLTTYYVTLDAGQGGGQYAEAEIWPLNEQTASRASEATVDHTAADDYPELGTILSDRLPPAIRATIAHMASLHPVTSAVPLLCRNCGVTYYTDNAADPHHEDCQEVNGEVLGAKHGFYLPLDNSRKDQQFSSADEQRGWEDGVKDGKAGITRNVQDPTNMAYRAGYDRGWAYGVDIYRAPAGGFDLGDFQTIEQMQTVDPPRSRLGSREDGEADLPFFEAGQLWNLIKGTDPRSDPTLKGYLSRDWCRYRMDGHCYYSKDLDTEASQQAGYAVWKPEDRGPCYRKKWTAQQACPIALPGPNVPGGFTDATKAWEAGGQHGGVPSNVLRSDAALSKTADEDQCPYCADDSLMVNGFYVCGEGHEWRPDDPAALAFHGDGPERGVLQPLANRLEKVRDAAQTLADGLPRCSGCGQAYTEIEGEFHDHWTAKEGLRVTAAQAVCPICDDTMLSQVLGMSCMKCGTVVPYCSTEGLLVLSDDGLLEDMRSRFAANTMVRTASLDPSIAFMLTATWRDVQQKAKRIRSEGGVRIIASRDGVVVAHVKGDTNVYETEVVKGHSSHGVSHWTCGCKWAAYSWGRSGPWKKYEGRMCSHALALQYEAQARNMFGRTLTLDESQPEWMDSTVPVRTPNSYDRNKGRYSHLRPVTEQDDDAPIRPLALKTKSFPAKVWGKFVRLFIKDGQVQDDDGTIYAAKDVLFPGYDPKAGLEYVDPDGHLAARKTASPLDDVTHAKTLEEAADDLLASARIEERTLTPMLTDLAAKEGGKMAGLEYRFKSKDSLLRKMRAEASMYPTPGQCAMNMSDSLRYTMLLPLEDYSVATKNVLDSLKTKGYSQRVKNYWLRGDCVDMETQCLTRRGWVNGDDLTYSDEILVVDQKTGTTLWTPVEGIHVFGDREYEIWGQRGFEVAATPGHQWLVQHHRPQRPGTGSRGPKGVDRGLRLVSTGGWTKYDHVPLALPCEDVQTEAKWSDDLVELIAWVMCEGHYRRERGSVTIAQKVHAARVEALLRRVGVSTVGRMDRIGCQQWEFGGDLARQVRALAPEKAPTVQWLGELTQAQLELFLNVCEMADGSSLRSSGRRSRSVFFQNRGPRLDSWLTACVLAGRAVSRYDVRGRNESWQIKQRQTASLRSMRKMETRNGRVWCPQTQFGTFVARRGANVFLTGNCYNGINVAMTSPDGHPVELQFHTDESLRVKEKDLHPIYEKWRTATDQTARAGLASQMVQMADTCTIPPGVHLVQPFRRMAYVQALVAGPRFLLIHDVDDAPLGLLRVDTDGDVARWEGGTWVTNPEFGRFTYLGEPRSHEITEEEAEGYMGSGLLNFYAHVTPKEAAMSAEEWGLLFEADLHEEPEPALPTTDGGDDEDDEDDEDDYWERREHPNHHGSVTMPDFVGGRGSDWTYKPTTASTTGDWLEDADVSGVDQAAMAVAAALAGAAHQQVVASASDEELQQMAEANVRAGGNSGDGDIMAAAQAGLQTEALKTYSPAERQQIIAEGEGGAGASNLDRLDLTGTHYEALEARRSATASESDAEDIGWDTMGDPMGDL